MPDIEGVPYETTGTPLDQASAQALAARHREAAAAGVRAETAVTTAQARADAAYALADAAATPAMVDQKVSTATTGLVTEAALADALEGFTGGGVESVSGTVTLDTTGEPIREFFTTGQASFVANGTTVSIGRGVAVVWRRVDSVWAYQQVVEGWTTPTPTPDTTKPTAGTLASSNVSDTSFTLTVSGASDDRALHTAPYRFSTDNGSTWTAYQASNTLAVTGKTASTAYTCKAEVRDAAGNTAQTASVTVTTTATPPLTFNTTVFSDSFNRPDGSLSGSAADTGQVWSTSGASIVSGRFRHAPGAGVTSAKHDITSGPVQGSFTFYAQANTAVDFRVAFLSPGGLKGDGFGVQVTRSDTRDIVQFEKPSGVAIQTTFNNNNGSLTQNNWAYLPGHAYAQDQTYAIRCVMTDTTITVYCNETRILEGTYTSPAPAPYLCTYGAQLPTGYLDDLKVMTP